MTIYDQALLHIDQTKLFSYSAEHNYTLDALNKKIKEICRLMCQSQKQKWALCLEDNFLFTAALFGLLYAGKTPVILGHMRTSLLNEQAHLFDGIIADAPLQVSTQVMIIDAQINHHETEFAYPCRLIDGKVILLTSGSTSEPKVLEKPVYLLDAETRVLLDKWQADFLGARLISTVTPLHQYGLTFVILMALCMHLPVNQNRIDFQEALTVFSDHAYVLISSPAFLKRLDSSLPFNGTLKAVFSAGGPLSFEEAALVARTLGILPTEVYGSSETGIIAHRCQTAGKTPFIPFDSVAISQYEDHSIKINSPLMISSDVRLNDVIEIEDEGFYLHKRLDKIIKIEEKRVSITEIEARILQFDNIANVAVIPLVEKRRTILGAVLVFKAPCMDVRAEFNRLRRVLADYVEPVAVPRRFRVVDRLPVNAQGKQSYYDLKVLFDEKIS